MNKKLAGTTTLLAATVTILATATAASASPRLPGSRIVGHAYIDGNTVGANTLIVQDRHADGTSTPDAVLSIGGAGTGAGLGSQGAIQATSDGAYLLVADAGSNEISVLRTHEHNLPTLLGTYPSGGVKPSHRAAVRP